MPPAMSVKERIDAVLRFRPVDRLPVVEWATWWDQTLRRWHAEGLPADADPTDFFGLDRLWQCWFPLVDAPRLPASARPGPPVASMDDYLAIREHLLHDHGPLAFDDAWWTAKMAAQREGVAAVWFTLEGFFWFPRRLLGVEPHLYAFYDQPELLHRINADLADHHLRLIERIRRHGAPVFMTFAEDMSYNHGPMLSRELFDEFLLPYYRKVLPAVAELGSVALVDSDGDVSLLLPWLEEAGVRGLLPLERQAGVDVAVLRERHPTLCFAGAFDKMSMRAGVRAMEAEFARLLPVARRGGLLVSVDHQTPPEVSLERYREFLDLFRRFARDAAP